MLLSRIMVAAVVHFMLYNGSVLAQKSFHQKLRVVDTHNDVLSTATMKGLDIGADLSGKTHSDLTRFKQGGVDIQFFSIFCDERFGADTAFAFANIEIDSLVAIGRRHPDKLAMVAGYKQALRANRKGRMAAMMGVEGGHMIEQRLDYLDSLYARGVRYMTLTWNNSTSWATSALDETTRGDSLPFKGLTAFGREVVRRMNALGIMVDISHVGETTFYDALETTTKPVLASHSSSHALCPVRRNLKDDQLRAVAKNGGVVCINFYSGFLDSQYAARMTAFIQNHDDVYKSLVKKGMPPYAVDEYLSKTFPEESMALRAPLALVLDHIDHVVRVAGINHVGIGSDFDGIESPPQLLNGVQDYPVLTRALHQRGYSRRAIRKIMGENVLRVLRANERH